MTTDPSSEMKPGFLKGIFDAAPESAPPADGWARMQADLDAQRKPIASWQWAIAALFLLGGVFVGLRPLWLADSTPLTNAGKSKTEVATEPSSLAIAPSGSGQSPVSEPVSQKQELASKTTSESNPSAAQDLDVDAKSAPVSNRPKHSQASGNSVAHSSTSFAAQSAAPTSRPEAETTLRSDPPREAVAGTSKTRGASMAHTLRTQSGSGEVFLAKAGSHKAKQSLAEPRKATSALDAMPITNAEPIETAIVNPNTGATDKGNAKPTRVETDKGSATPASAEKQAREDSKSEPNSSDYSNAATQENNQRTESPTAAQPAQEVAPDQAQASNVPAVAGSPKEAKTDSVNKAPTKTQEEALAAKPEEVIKTQKKGKIPFFFEATGRLLLRQRDAKLESRADYAHLAWTQPQPKVLPGLEVAGSVGYRVSPTFSLGTQVGLGVWQEKLDVDVSQKEGATTLTTPASNTILADANYGKAVTQSSQWTMAQAHTELWFRYAPKSLPLAIQAAATLDALRTAGEKGPVPQAHKLNPGWAVALRYQPGHFFYEAGVRQPQRNSVAVPDYYKIKYQFISVGIGYSW